MFKQSPFPRTIGFDSQPNTRSIHLQTLGPFGESTAQVRLTTQMSDDFIAQTEDLFGVLFEHHYKVIQPNLYDNFAEEFESLLRKHSEVCKTLDSMNVHWSIRARLRLVFDNYISTKIDGSLEPIECLRAIKIESIILNLATREQALMIKTLYHDQIGEVNFDSHCTLL